MYETVNMTTCVLWKETEHSSSQLNYILFFKITRKAAILTLEFSTSYNHRKQVSYIYVHNPFEV